MYFVQQRTSNGRSTTVLQQIILGLYIGEMVVPKDPEVSL